MATHSSILTWRISMDRGTWRATAHWVAKSQTQLKQLSTHAHTGDSSSPYLNLKKHFCYKKIQEAHHVFESCASNRTISQVEKERDFREQGPHILSIGALMKST